MQRHVNVYEVTRHYGGPEEGGWWYDTGEPVISVTVDGKNAGEVEACELILMEDLQRAYPDTGERYSMAPRATDYEVRIEEHAGEAWPDERPHYE
jgi:hypothetical protein